MMNEVQIREDLSKIFDKIETVRIDIATIKAEMPKQPCDYLRNVDRILTEHLEQNAKDEEKSKDRWWQIVLATTPRIMYAVLLIVLTYYGFVK